MISHNANRDIGECIIISCEEQSPPQIPCIFYQLDSEKGELIKLREIPLKKEVRRIEAYHEFRKLIIWGGADGFNRQVHIIDPDNLSSEKVFQLPYELILKSYLTNDGANQGIVVYGKTRFSDKNYKLSNIDEVNNVVTETQPEQMQLDKVIMNGSSGIRKGTGFSHNFSVDDNGNLTSKITARRLNNIKFNAEMLTAFKNSPSRGHVKVLCNDDHHVLMRNQVPTRSGERGDFFVYDKQKQEWSMFQGTGPYDYPQMFKDWWVIQSTSQEPGKQSQLTAKFTFVDRESLERIVWKKSPDTEVLGIWGTQMIYRIKDELYSAQIGKSQITGDKLMIKDSRITNVHWIFPKEAK